MKTSFQQAADMFQQMVVVKPMKTMREEIIELYHIARVPCGLSRYERMIYVKQELLKKYPDKLPSPKQLWLLIEDSITGI